MPDEIEHICHLCGKEIDYNLTDGDLSKTREHIPPQQFYPLQMRGDIKGHLLVRPTHKGCNLSFKLDEEYFVHTYCPHVNTQSISGRQLIEDIQRRTENTGNQSHRLLAMIEREFSSISPGGIHLPYGTVIHNINATRVDRIIRKILQGLHYCEEGSFLPYETPMWIHLYEKYSDIPEHFRFCETGPCLGVYPKIFAYRHTTVKDYVYWSMLLWDSLLFCIVFKNLKSNQLVQGTA